MPGSPRISQANEADPGALPDVNRCGGWPYTDQQPKLPNGPCSSSRLMVVVSRGIPIPLPRSWKTDSASSFQQTNSAGQPSPGRLSRSPGASGGPAPHPGPSARTRNRPTSARRGCAPGRPSHLERCRWPSAALRNASRRPREDPGPGSRRCRT